LVFGFVKPARIRGLLNLILIIDCFFELSWYLALSNLQGLKKQDDWTNLQGLTKQDD
jgi:hypothetical protein